MILRVVAITFLWILVSADATAQNTGVISMDRGPRAAWQTCAVAEQVISAFSLDPARQVISAQGKHLINQAKIDKNDPKVDLWVTIKPANQSAVTMEFTTPAGQTSHTIDLTQALAPQIRGLVPEPFADAFSTSHRAIAGDLGIQSLCTNNSTVSFEQFGAALSPALIRRAWTPPTDAKKSVLLDWSHGRAALKQSKNKSAIEYLLKAQRGLEKGETAPGWHQRTVDGEHASQVSFIGDTAIVFGEGHFKAIDPVSGEQLWKIKLGKSNGRLIDSGQDSWLAITSTGLIALNPRTGQTKWKLKRSGLYDEIAIQNDILVAASAREIVALGIKDGTVLWRKTPRSRIIAGPVPFENRVAVPLTTQVSIFDIGAPTKIGETEFDDEISGPIVTSSGNRIWALIGGKRMAAIEASSESTSSSVIPKQRFWIQNAMAVQWPPSILGNSLIIAAQHSRKGPFIAQFNLSSKIINKRIIWGGEQPLIVLPDFRSLAYFSNKHRKLNVRDRQGRPRWSKTFKKPARGIISHKGLLWSRIGSQLVALDQETGKERLRVEFGEAVIDFAFGKNSGVAITESGSIYDVPTSRSAMWQFWLNETRLDLAKAYFMTGKTRKAKRLIEDVLDRNPNYLKAQCLAVIVSAKSRSTDAVSQLLKVQSRLHWSHPWQTEIAATLSANIGLEQKLETESPVRDLILTNDGMSVGLTEKHVVAFDLKHQKAIWTRPGKTIRPLNDKQIIIDNRIINISDGRDLGILADRHYNQGHSEFYLLSADTISSQALGGRTLWRKHLDYRGARLLGQSDKHLIIAMKIAANSPQDRIEVRRKTDGQLVWVRPFIHSFSNVHVSGNYLLLQAVDKIIGLSLNDGGTAFQAKLPANELVNISALNNAWLLQSSKKLIKLSLDGGRTLGSFRFREKPKAIAVAKDAHHAFLLYADGSLGALDLSTLRLKATLKGHKTDALYAGKTQIAGTSEDGKAIYIFDAKQALKMRKD